MAKIIKRTVYLLSVGGRYLDEDGDPVAGWSSAYILGSKLHVHIFLKENPAIAAKHPRIVPREFSEKELTGLMKSYGFHMRLKRRDPQE